ncbi:phosphoadenosine phosphosulfate reductase family protein [Lacrimispora sp.]|uniref:phosphoadenosine phosphosulfate reductase family protein n=1 Tax=Lacrimispora sp. TaxID=2719234 RepID=UPI00399535F9
MLCKKCMEELTSTNIYPSDHRYCIMCSTEHSTYLSERRQTLTSLREMNLESKIIQTKYLIRRAVMEFGLDKVYISYSGGKDSTVLSHIAKTMYPDILHLFANTTNEYPETIQHIKWEKEENGTNIIVVLPTDAKGNTWTFKKVVDTYGYPMYSKRVSNAIRTYQHALSERTKQNSQDYLDRNFKKYEKYKNLPISDKCCDKLKKEPLRRKAKELGLDCAILGILASESYQREKDWLEYGCNVFHERKDNQSRPLSFWNDEDILEYIDKYNVKIPRLYDMGYSRNGCMYCGFGVHLEPNGQNRYQRLKETHPVQYQYFISNFGNLMIDFEISVA